MGAYSSIIGSFIRMAQNVNENEAKNIFLSGWLGELDYNTLLGMIHDDNKTKVMLEDEVKIDQHLKEKSKKVDNKPEWKIMFPGIQCCHDTLAAAKNYLKGGLTESKQKNPRKVIFMISGAKSFMFRDYKAMPHGGHDNKPHKCSTTDIFRNISHRTVVTIESFTEEQYSKTKFYNIFKVNFVQKPGIEDWVKKHVEFSKPPAKQEDLLKGLQEIGDVLSPSKRSKNNSDNGDDKDDKGDDAAAAGDKGDDKGPEPNAEEAPAEAPPAENPPLISVPKND